jgi:hypothetical protein
MLKRGNGIEQLFVIRVEWAIYEHAAIQWRVRHDTRALFLDKQDQWRFQIGIFVLGLFFLQLSLKFSHLFDQLRISVRGILDQSHPNVST